ncbi:TetR/AcrR family transcriptional regulator [Thalassospira marina]|uniref:TetR family transcriptional regulator n=1 Tax=Thalassospira marina TaxID=2048283 RepID=A0A2N3KEI1_9PROT|nr:TetR/AcrR family transcriptional regulator [Thalassospira marina]PKR48930.1 TetR family transcriptional regulator [Thalassospira marina]
MTKAHSSPVSSPVGQRGRPREFDLDAALDGAIGVFTRKGFHGVSVAELAGAMNVSAGSLYKAFPDKHAIFIAALDRYICLRQANIAARLTNAQSGHAALAAILTAYAELASGEGGKLGCLVVASNVELGSDDAVVANRIAAQLGRYRQRFADLLKQGQLDGTIRADIDPDDMASLLLCVTQGMRVVGKTGQSFEAMQRTVSQMLLILA